MRKTVGSRSRKKAVNELSLVFEPSVNSKRHVGCYGGFAFVAFSFRSVIFNMVQIEPWSCIMISGRSTSGKMDFEVFPT